MTRTSLHPCGENGEEPAEGATELEVAVENDQLVVSEDDDTTS